MKQFLLEPGNPLTQSEEVLKPIIQAVQDIDPTYQVGLAYRDQRGYGVTWWEVLHIWIPWATLGGVAAKKIVELAIDWAYGRLKRDKPKNRPRSVTIYGPQGQVLKKVEVDQSGQEIVPSPGERPRRVRPEVRHWIERDYP